MTGTPAIPASVHQRHSLEISSDTDLLGAGALLPAGASARSMSPLATPGGQVPTEAAVTPSSPILGKQSDTTIKQPETNLALPKDSRPKVNDFSESHQVLSFKINPLSC